MAKQSTHGFLSVADCLARLPIRMSKSDLPAEAVRQFIDEMIEYGAGYEFEWKRISRSYASMRAERGWPVLTDQILSGYLIALGCKKRRMRVVGGSRPTFFELPQSFEEVFAMAG